jgi:hypothetical protein
MERRDDRLPEELTAAAAEMIPVIGPIAGLLTKRSVAKIREEHARRVSIALQAAERLSGMTRQELGDAIADDPRLVPLVTRVLYAAGMNGHNRTLAAMGAALGDVVRERERLDGAELILTALADLSDAHIHVLVMHTSMCYRRSPPDDEPSALHIRELSGLPSPVVGLCLAGLIGRGLVEATTGLDAQTEYDISELGRTLWRSWPS